MNLYGIDLIFNSNEKPRREYISKVTVSFNCDDFGFDLLVTCMNEDFIMRYVFRKNILVWKFISRFIADSRCMRCWVLNSLAFILLCWSCDLVNRTFRFISTKVNKSVLMGKVSDEVKQYICF